LLLRLARAQGCRVISGLEMFLAQAACQFEYWTDLPAPVPAMRRAALEALQRLDHIRAR
jgi:shikimate 5-dehydrogenase